MDNDNKERCKNCDALIASSNRSLQIVEQHDDEDEEEEQEEEEVLTNDEEQNAAADDDCDSDTNDDGSNDSDSSDDDENDESSDDENPNHHQSSSVPCNNDNSKNGQQQKKKQKKPKKTNQDKRRERRERRKKSLGTSLHEDDQFGRSVFSDSVAVGSGENDDTGTSVDVAQKVKHRRQLGYHKSCMRRVYGRKGREPRFFCCEYCSAPLQKFNKRIVMSKEANLLAQSVVKGKDVHFW